MSPVQPEHTHAPALRGGLLAVLAALLFGLSTPLIQRLGAGLGAFTTAALLYAGAAGAGRCCASRPRARRGCAGATWGGWCGWR
jgi:drug/metabolite transporter (DMT)-like permease